MEWSLDLEFKSTKNLGIYVIGYVWRENDCDGKEKNRLKGKFAQKNIKFVILYN